MRSSLFLLPLLLAGCTATQTASLPPAGPQLHARTFGPARGDTVRTLVVVLHDDGAPERREDHYAFAASIAAAIPASAAIALLRPGFADGEGNRSPGDAGSGTGDNFTLDRIGAVADTLRGLQARYPKARLVLVGDAGGAAIAANLAGIRPDLVDGLVLVACPCALPEWRRHMRWAAPVTSLDPLQTAGGVLPPLRAAVLVGADDTVTPVRLSRSYVEALTLRGIATDYRIVPDKGHALLNDPEVLSATTRLAASLPVRP